MRFQDGSYFGVVPSILSSDFANLERDLRMISNADGAHIDVMDYHFVPNLTFGGPVVERIVEICSEVNQEKQAAGQGTFISDVHLMIEDPDRWALDYGKRKENGGFGADSVTFHYNAAAAPVRLARELRAAGAKASISLRPAEPVEPLFDILDEFDMILIMTVEPGFGGQKFLDNQMAKVGRLRSEIEKLPEDKRPILEVDGGVSRGTVETVANAGSNFAVAGSAVFGAQDPRAEIDLIRQLGCAQFRKQFVSRENNNENEVQI
jgi:ribulose-phosphate 3-epimerase